MHALRPRATRLLAVGALALSALAGTAAGASADAQSDYDTGLALGTKAYQFGLPLLDFQRLYETQTSVNVPDGKGNGPINRFSHLRKLANAADRNVVAPNDDTLYSLAWLDVKKEPQVVTVPAVKDRFYVIPFYDAYTNDFYNVTSNKKSEPGAGDYGRTNGGSYAVVPPGFKGKLPKGVKKVQAPQTRVYILGRTYIKGEADTKAVNKIQDGYTVTPLSKFGKRFSPKAPKKVDKTVTKATIPGTQPGEEPLDFYTALGKQVQGFPGPAADKPLLDEIKAIGVGPGLDPAKAKLSEDTLRGMRDAVTKGQDTLQSELVKLFLGGFERNNGYLTVKTGTYGTNYLLRAIVDKVGLGAPRSDVAVYPIAQTDRTKATLNGDKRYVLHVPKGQLPPVGAFWSLTLYDSDGFFVQNSLKRYLLNDLSKLHANGDGSIDLFVQSAKPSSPDQVQNWLPAPAGKNFRLFWRLYDAKALDKIVDGSGWQPPAILACDDSGKTSAGTACAS
jgi:hypothetical protein